MLVNPFLVKQGCFDKFHASEVRNAYPAVKNGYGCCDVALDWTSDACNSRGGCLAGTLGSRLLLQQRPCSLIAGLKRRLGTP